MHVLIEVLALQAVLFEAQGERSAALAALERAIGLAQLIVNLLNIGDGFLGEHLKLHVIATTNAPVRQLDPALLRPGRLMGSREFRRLTRPEAQRLAEAKGLKILDQPDYSLGEIYCGAVGGPLGGGERQVGFAQ